MKVRGNTMPVTAFTLEPIPKKPGRSLVRFYENAEPFSEAGFEWDEYHLELASYPNLESDVTANYDMLINQAKMLEAQENMIPLMQTAQEQTRADIEYLSMMLEVDL